jgi:hypothetical protein
MKKKGYSSNAASRICGQIEKNMKKSAAAAASNMRYEDNNGHLYIKAFLLDASENINSWGVTAQSLDKNVNTFIGKPLVLTETFRHPMPPELDRVGDTNYYDNDDDPYNTINVNEIVDHWLQYQEAYRIGSIIDITEKNGTYYAIIEVTDPAAKDAFRNNDVPLFVSPAIAQLDPLEDAANITNWTGIHLAVVSEPAYTINKAIISGQCHDNKDRCLLQLRQAAIENKKIPRIGCGFCRTKALARYAEIVKSWHTKHSVVITKDPHDFVNSSIGFSDTNSNLEELTNNDQDTNNNQNTTSSDTTNKPQDFERVQAEQGGDLGEQQNQKGNKETIKKEEKETETETATTEVTSKEAEVVGIKVAGMEECVQIFQQNGVQPDQAMQICKLAAQALMDNNQQNNNNPQGGSRSSANGPSPSGQFGSVTEYEKELTKHQLKISELQEELKRYKKDDKTDAQRIAELEETVNTLNRTLKEKEIESYLVTKIADEKFRNEKIKRFADLNLTLDDIKDIFEVNTPPLTKTGNGNGNGNIIKKTAEVEIPSPPSPISRVKLQVASTKDDNNTTATINNEIKERNNKLFSSLLSNGGINYS